MTNHLVFGFHLRCAGQTYDTGDEHGYKNHSEPRHPDILGAVAGTFSYVTVGDRAQRFQSFISLRSRKECSGTFSGAFFGFSWWR